MKIVLGETEALKLVHGFDLLFSSHPRCVEGFVLLLYAGDFFLHLLLPVISFALSPL